MDTVRDRLGIAIKLAAASENLTGTHILKKTKSLSSSALI